MSSHQSLPEFKKWFPANTSLPYYCENWLKKAKKLSYSGKTAKNRKDFKRWTGFNSITFSENSNYGRESLLQVTEWTENKGWRHYSCPHSNVPDFRTRRNLRWFFRSRLGSHLWQAALVKWCCRSNFYGSRYIFWIWYHLGLKTAYFGLEEMLGKLLIQWVQ